MNVTGDKLTNIKHAERLIRDAVYKFKPRLVVLPEYFNTKLNKTDIELFAETFPTGETFRTLELLAKELDIYLVGGSIPERDDKTTIYNTTLVFAPTGRLIAKYRKIHLLDVDVGMTEIYGGFRDIKKLRETDFIKSGKELTTFELDGIKVGLGIGYDLCFGELTRLYRLKGVDLVIFPSRFTEKLGKLKFELLTKARAVDNQLYLLAVEQARDYRKDVRLDEDDVFKPFGRSLLVDFKGRIVARGGDDEELIYYYLDFKELDFYRKKYDLFRDLRTDVYDTVYKY